MGPSGGRAALESSSRQLSGMRRLPTPKRRLTAPKRRRAQRLRTNCIDFSIEVLSGFDEETLADLLARGDLSPRPDGYPTSSRSAGRSSEPTSSTESAAIALVDSRITPDPIGDAVSELVSILQEFPGMAKRCKQLRSVIENAADTVKDASEPDHCLACGREVAGTRSDRLRGGYCNSCDYEFRKLPPDQRD